MDLLSGIAFGLALIATGAAAWFARSRRSFLALGLLLVAAFVLRANLAAHLFLSDWDERYHAVVARNLIDHPLVPTLIDRPLVEQPPENWTRSHVWLHKPPLALWTMAGSMALFGENEIALRLPSLLVGTAGVAVTFLLAHSFLGAEAALVAAGFHAWHGRSAMIGGGLRATDHVDTLLIFLVAVGALAAIRAADALAEGRRGGAWLVAATGALMGLGYLTKASPALIVLVVLFFRLWTRTPSWRLRLGAPAGALGVAVACALPWRLYTAVAFPEAHAYASGLNVSHLIEAVDGQGGPWYFHLANIPEYFGVLSWIALVCFLVEGARRRRDWLPLLAWFLVTYGVFSIAATKMKSYVFIASPVLWCALGWFCVEAGRRLQKRPARLAHAALAGAVVLAFFVTSPLQAQRYHKALLRSPTWAEELRYLGARVSELPGDDWVVFNVPSPLEAHFYARATFEAHLPTSADLAQAERRGLRVAVYGDVGDPELAALGEQAGLRFVPYDPRSRAARAFVAELRRRGARDPLVYNARAPDDLEEYAERTLSLDVHADLPRDDRRLRRAREAGRSIVVLVPGGFPPPQGLSELVPEAWILEVDDLAN